MTVLIAALDGLDYEYVQQQDLLSSLEPRALTNDLQGANALYTYRIWPELWTGQLGAGRADEPYKSFETDAARPWDKYSAKVLLAPEVGEPVVKHQQQFADGYARATGPQSRLDTLYRRFNQGVKRAIDEGYYDIIVVGCKVPDILGHNDQNKQRIEDNIARICDLVEDWAALDGISDHFVVSDHGFEYHEFGNEPSGLTAHTRRATLASSFADYSSMSALIDG